jgi:hypothetical protein
MSSPPCPLPLTRCEPPKARADGLFCWRALVIVCEARVGLQRGEGSVGGCAWTDGLLSRLLGAAMVDTENGGVKANGTTKQMSKNQRRR